MSSSTVGPAVSELGDDAVEFLDGAAGRICVAGPEDGGERAVSAEDVQRQVAVVALVAVEEVALLPSVRLVVDAVDVEDQACGERAGP